ncbi:hypothetical protein TNCV_1364761 [Trichonephila clavipes]|nr:hypothetical protein TNCV_1364761 [Trichonephila clavipes]
MIKRLKLVVGHISGLLSSIERYDALHNSWEEFPASLPVPRMAMGVTAGENHIWVAGGIIRTKRLCIVVDSVWCYDHDYKWTATAGSDVVQSGRPIFDDFSQHLWPYIGNNTANVVFRMVKRFWLIRKDQ